MVSLPPDHACPTCNQPIPSEKVEEIRARMEARERELLEAADLRVAQQIAAERTRIEAAAIAKQRAIEQAKADAAAAAKAEHDAQEHKLSERIETLQAKAGFEYE